VNVDRWGHDVPIVKDGASSIAHVTPPTAM
jgi:hypothetical protein